MTHTPDDRRDGSSASPRVAVVGPGAIGAVVAAALHEAGRTPVLYGRSARDRLEVIARDDRILVPGPVVTDPSRARGPVDLVFLAVKATQTEAVAPWLDALCGPGTVVCVLQNGVEQRARVGAILPRGRVLPAVVWFPAETTDDGCVRLLADARLTVPDTAEAQRVVDVLDGTRCAVDLAADFPSLAWRKLLQNAAAGLMALTGRRAGVFRRDDIARLTRDYLGEALAVALAEGANLSDKVVDEILDGFRRSPVDRGTSILADRTAGRPLEWDIRNGVVSRLGRAHGVPTPIADVVTALLAATSDGPG